MQVAALNARARRRYDELVGAMDMAVEALESTRHLIALMDLKGASSTWTVPTQDELSALRVKALTSLDTLRTRVKKYEAELVSRDWRL